MNCVRSADGFIEDSMAIQWVLCSFPSSGMWPLCFPILRTCRLPLGGPRELAAGRIRKDKPTNKQTDRQTKKQTNTQRNKETNKPTNQQTSKETKEETNNRTSFRKATQYCQPSFGLGDVPAGIGTSSSHPSHRREDVVCPNSGLLSDMLQGFPSKI